MSGMSTIKVQVWLGIHQEEKKVYVAETTLKGYTMPHKDTQLVLSIGDKRGLFSVNTIEAHYSPIGAEEHFKLQCGCHQIDQWWMDKKDPEQFERMLSYFRKDRRWKLETQDSEAT